MADKAVPTGWHERIGPTLDEVSDTCRTVLGLSSAGIGLIINTFKDSPERLHAVPTAIAIGLFVLSIGGWFFFSASMVDVRTLFAATTTWTAEQEKKIDTCGKTMERWILVQRLSFTTGVIGTCIAVYL